MKIIILIIFICYLLYVLSPLLKRLKYTVASVKTNSELGFGISYIKKVWFIFDVVHRGGGYLLLNIVLLTAFLIVYANGPVYTPSNDKNYGSNYDSEYSEIQIYEEDIDSYDDEYSNGVGYGYVNSYVRSDGTEVSGHYRTDPDEYEENNFSYDGNESNDWDYEYHD